MLNSTRRHNYRNEALKLRALLLSACKLLEDYGVEMPASVASWWAAQKSLALIHRVKRSEFGVLQMAIDAEEKRLEAINDETTNS